MGAYPGPSLVTQTAFTYTSTRSTFSFTIAGKVQLDVTFLSPVYPDDFVKKSLQYSYVDTRVYAIDGATHSVSIYMDISGGKTSCLIFPFFSWALTVDLTEWMAGDRSTVINWETGTYNGVAYHGLWNPSQTLFTENNDQANWGTVFFATPSTSGVR